MIVHRMPKYNCTRFSSFAAIFIVCIISLVSLSGCSVFMSSATSDMMEHLSGTILNNDDLALVETGAPAYLLMIDSLISQDPENENMLSTGASLYSAYADLFVKDIERSRKMADKALNYSNQAICLSNNDACNLKSKTFEEFEIIISGMHKKNVPALFALGNAWAGWIMANKSDFNAIADIAHIELIMKRIIQLDDKYKDGSAYLYLGTLSSLLPKALGGRPEQGKIYFEKAIKMSRGKNLAAKVLFAKMYARITFNRPLHDRLLNEVIDFDPHAPGYTLVNTWAQKQARELLNNADDYF
jgi:hypothetical protein